MPRNPTGKTQLAKLAYAHLPIRRQQTPRNEDYIEIISELIHEKGYAKPVDIATHLHVKRPTVTGMLNKLRQEQFIVHEKYGGIILTEKGSSMADMIRKRHGLLVEFLKLLGTDETRAQKDTEGLEHYIDPRTLELVARLVQYASQNPEWWSRFQQATQPAK